MYRSNAEFPHVLPRLRNATVESLAPLNRRLGEHRKSQKPATSA